MSAPQSLSTNRTFVALLRLCPRSSFVTSEVIGAMKSSGVM